MAFSGIAEIFSSVTSRFSTAKSSTGPYVSSGLPPLGGPVHGFGSPGSRQKNLLRLSSSLQDFSAYRRLDPEDGNFGSVIENSSPIKNQNHFLRENGGTSFSKEKSSSQTSVRRQWVKVIMILLCLLFLAFLIYGLLFLYSNWAHGSARFYVVLDCGSTGTRVYVYQASINHQKSETLPIMLKSIPEDLKSKPSSESGRAYNRMETEPGFDKLVHNSSGLKHAIKPLLKWAEKQIPKHAHKTTSVFLYATAGVRRLPSSDSDWLLKNAWSIMKHSSFLCRKEWIKIISGMEEAYYGWIALNYHARVLGAIPKKETFGALDLGGSSLQVTFESQDYSNNETSLNLRIGPLNHHLSAYSLAGYGLNDAFDKSVIHLLRKSPQPNLLKGKAVIKHPCLQSGYKEKYICTQCQSAFQSNRRKILGKGGKTGIPVQLIGAPKWEECRALAKSTVNLSEWSTKSQGIDCDLQPCALQNNLPRPYGQFYAMSGFYVVYRFFNLSSDASLDDVLEKGRDFCEKTWDIAKNSVPPQPFIEQYCFRAPYTVLLLREGLHITDRQVNIGSGGITWTTGVALLEAGNAISTRASLRNYRLLQMKMNPFIISVILFSSLCLVACALSCAGKCGPRFFRRLHLPLFRHNSASGTSVLNISSPFNFRRWSPIISGEGRVKMPLSPVASAQNRAFGPDIQLAESSLYPSSSSIAHSFSSSSLGQAQFDSSSNMGAFYSGPHRGQMRLQSRRSQSREDLNCSIADAHLVKV
ncbi:probable apyrase 7 [Rutidosis leptorrhynchoides]|uniref:probable apyrase 7 n=1 Tax=Rutidosis leptorrhynchoides TaxID=125765 RepID=UPI003A99615D